MAMGPTNSWEECALMNGNPGSGITRRAIRRSDRHRGWLRSNFVARERHEADHRPITPSIWGRSESDERNQCCSSTQSIRSPLH
jgi:hypothetical protein